MPRFNISDARRSRGERQVRVVSVAGDIDAATFPRLQDRLERLAGERERAIVVDCADLDYISSAGIMILKKMALELRDQGGDIRLAALSDKISNIVNQLGFSRWIKVFKTVDQAVESY